ncbi:FecCD family ABC transporter permease [Enterobacter asburiae]|uniref:FecCD family ABC transporter permease n=1 Tax=Enterobacter asburiae TaxID=61645 RepID=UPI003F4348DC
MMRSSLAFPIFALLLALGAIMHLGIGARFIAPQTVVEAFFHFDPRNFDHNVIIKLRLLRLCAAMVTGAALGVAGVLLQSVIRNPLGEPHILGLNAGAALAVVITSALGLSLPFGRPLVAAAGAAALFLLVLMFSSSGRTGLTPMKVTLCGVAMSAFASSITAAVLILDEQTLLAMRTWLAGDLAGINVQTLRSALWAATAGFVLAIGLSPSLNMLALDADFVFATWRGDTGGKPQDELAAMDAVMPGWCQFLNACRTGHYVLISREEAISNSYASLGLMAAQVQSQIAGRPLPEASR